MSLELKHLIFWIGFGQLGVLIASAIVPFRLNWKSELAGLPLLLRQLFWVYGGYIVLSIMTLGTLCLLFADELAGGSGLARGVCAYGAAFWGIRLTLQPLFDAGPFLTTWWLRGGYHLLTLLFVVFTAVYAWGVVA